MNPKTKKSECPAKSYARVCFTFPILDPILRQSVLYQLVLGDVEVVGVAAEQRHGASLRGRVAIVVHEQCRQIACAAMSGSKVGSMAAQSG